ncbi:hypothetical protein AOC36_01265 [Erysipelothrix larvae]|uniref:Uncharacterized protein n=1 Tax=Erysipelothrix larvae TaxID=1514105 RepID=A0A109UGG6_9FIRM|nr:hypothetical protein [Erysipelothrix larvae]AMC92668.1 hypothetical protein AOC36_01265 [Erysipelothrix larvae]
MLDAVELESWTVQKTQYNQVASGSLQSMQGTFDSIDFTQKAKACGSYDGYLIETKYPSTNPETQAYIMVCEEIGEMIFIFSYW